MLHQTILTTVVDDFCYSHPLSGQQCIDNVRRNYILITPGSERVKGQAPDKLTVCEHNFAQLPSTSCLTFSIKYHIQDSETCLTFVSPYFLITWHTKPHYTVHLDHVPANSPAIRCTQLPCLCFANRAVVWILDIRVLLFSI